MSALDDYTPSTITRSTRPDGRVIGEFATQRRVIIELRGHPAAAAPGHLWRPRTRIRIHFGVRHLAAHRHGACRLIKAASGLLDAGASTLTQQLARKLFLKPEKTLERKVKEVVLTLQIEKRYTKHEIFTLYCNQMNLGHGAYGVEAAARVYFGKPVKDLTLEEAATIAGILQLPERQSPYVNQKWRHAAPQLHAAAHGRRGLHHGGPGRRGREAAHRARRPARAVERAPRRTSSRRCASTSRRQYGAQAAVRGRAVGPDDARRRPAGGGQRALDRGLRALDKRQGYRKPARNVRAEGHTIDELRRRRWDRPIAAGDIVPAV